VVTNVMMDGCMVAALEVKVMLSVHFDPTVTFRQLKGQDVVLGACSSRVP